MLVISRKKGESVTIAGNIRVVVLKVGNKDMKIGIEAPAEVKILRTELLNKENANDGGDERQTK